MSKQALEQQVYDLLGDILNLKMNPGSGNKRGDGDLSPKQLNNNGTFKFGFECKDKNVDSHTVPRGEWKKAKNQLEQRGLEPIFVTRNAEGEILVHFDINLFKDIVVELKENYLV